MLLEAEACAAGTTYKAYDGPSCEQGAQGAAQLSSADDPAGRRPPVGCSFWSIHSPLFVFVPCISMKRVRKSPQRLLLEFLLLPGLLSSPFHSSDFWPMSGRDGPATYRTGEQNSFRDASVLGLSGLLLPGSLCPYRCCIPRCFRPTLTRPASLPGRCHAAAVHVGRSKQFPGRWCFWII